MDPPGRVLGDGAGPQPVRAVGDELAPDEVHVWCRERAVPALACGGG